jgi:threonine/homoserine/homoserine lactone efflux protein
MVQRLKVVAGVVALGAGLLALTLIVVLTLLLEPSTTAAPIISGAVSAIGSIVAAYFGIKLGNDNASAEREQTDKAVGAQRQEARKAQALAAIAPPEEARAVLDELGVRAGSAPERGSRGE